MKITQKINICHTLWNKYKGKDGFYSLKIRVGLEGKYAYIKTKYRLSESEYRQMSSSNAKAKWVQVNEDLNKTISECYLLIEQLGSSFNIRTFSKDFKNRHRVAIPRTVNDYYEFYIAQLKNGGNSSNSETYRTSLNSLLKFVNRKTIFWEKGQTVNFSDLPIQEINFEHIDVAFLKSYEAWMLKCGSSKSTVGFYLRPLRAIFNLAQKDGINLSYPFFKGGYTIPNAASRKWYLTIEEVNRIIDCELTDENELYARDMFLFSLYGCGINPVDMALLTSKNIHNDIIVFNRKKTRKTLNQNVEIRIPISKKMQEILNRSKCTGNYLFSILEGGETDAEIRDKVQKRNKTINKYLERVAQKAQIAKKVTMYYARHSFATIAKNNGAPIQYIMESLGHTSQKTTQNYLGNYSDKQLRGFHELFTKI